MPRPSEKLRIFVVDDEHIIALTIALILQHGGFDATAFTRPMEALSAARIQAPCLVISDVAMPVLTGIELAALILKYCPTTKILLFSGQAPDSNLFQIATQSGQTFEFLSKPIHPIEFMKKVRAMVYDVDPSTDREDQTAASPA